MRPTWGTVGVAAVLGCALGAAATRALWPTEGPTPAGRPAGDAAPREDGPAGEGGSGAERTPGPASEGGAPASGATDPRDPAGDQAGRVRGLIDEFAAARSSRKREAFDRALRALLRESDAAAHVVLRDLVADPAFDFPDGHMAVWFGASDALRGSAVPAWAAAARARYERDGRSPGCTWDAGAWLYLVAAHGDAEDLAWVAAQYDTAPERPGEAIAALGAARPELACEALLREIARRPRRDGLWNAIANLARRSPADAFVVLQALVEEEGIDPAFERTQVLRLWARTAPAAALGDVRARILAMAAAEGQDSALIAPVQVLADRGESVAEFADILASAGRELRGLVDEKKAADGTGPYYAIEYYRVAQTPENLAALQYAIQVLGPEKTTGCQAILAKARARSEWK